MGELLRFPQAFSDGDEPDTSLDDLFRAFLPRTGVEVLDGKGSLLCLGCGKRWKADFRKVKNEWPDCPNRCNAG